MDKNQEVVFTNTDLFKDQICEMSGMYNKKTQQRMMIPKFKNELLKSVLTGNWDFFTAFEGLKKLLPTTGTINVATELKQEKYAMFVSKEKIMIGLAIKFEDRPEDYTGFTKYEARLAKLFAYEKGVQGRLQFDATVYCEDSDTYSNVLNVCEIFMSQLIMGLIKMEDDKFTNDVYGHTVNGIEIISYLGLKSISNKIAQSELEYKKLKEDVANEKKTKRCLDGLSAYYKVHDFICRIILQDFTLESFKWYTFMNTKIAEKLISGGYKAIFAIDSEGLIVKHKSPVDTVINMTNKDTLTYTARDKSKNYTFEMNTTQTRSVGVTFGM